MESDEKGEQVLSLGNEWFKPEIMIKLLTDAAV
jgi:hypothetical protein